MKEIWWLYVGAEFGELAILNRVKWSATIKSLDEPVEFATLSNSDYFNIMRSR